MHTISNELEWIDFLDSQYTQFEKSHQQIKESPDNIVGNVYPKSKETKYIDRIMIHETLPNQGRIKNISLQTENDSTMKSKTNYKNNENWRDKTFRVGKLDVTKIEQYSKECELGKEESQKYNKENKV